MTANDDLITIKNLPFPYEVKIESKPAFQKVGKLQGRGYSYTGMCLTMKRNSYGQLIGGFYYSTLSFAVLSLVSYLIKPDIVSTYYLLNILAELPYEVCINNCHIRFLEEWE